MNFSKIRMMFFDFDDTLLVHYREQKLDATADAHRARLLRYEAENRGGYKVFDEIGEANTLVQHFLESCDGIPKYCITRVQDSMTLPYKEQWLEMHYPGQFLDVIGTATPERKTSVMKLLTQAAGLNAAQALYVDDYYEALNEAAKEGFTVMTVQELMLSNDKTLNHELTKENYHEKDSEISCRCGICRRCVPACFAAPQTP